LNLVRRLIVFGLVAAGTAGCATALGGHAATPELPQSFTLSLGDHQRIGSLTITPLEIVEDSRCPQSVACIQAGTVRAKIALAGNGSTTTPIVGLAAPVAVGTTWLHLRAVCPYPIRPSPRIAKSAYRLSFTLAPDRESTTPAEPCGA